MSRLTRRVAVKAKAQAAPAKTYTDFQAHIATLGASSATWSASPAGTGGGKKITTAAAQTGGMDGSSWNAPFRRAAGTVTCRVIQHALPSEAVFLAQIANSQDIYFEVVDVGSVAFTGVTRNGYTSGSASASTGQRVVDLIRWDDTLKKAFRSNPSTGGAETEYPIP